VKEFKTSTMVFTELPENNSLLHTKVISYYGPLKSLGMGHHNDCT